MPLRLIEMVLPENHLQEATELLQEHQFIDIWYDRISEDQTYIKILASVEETEALIDQLDKYYGMVEGFRIVLLPVAATIPRLETPEATPPQPEEPPPAPETKSQADRISREELYAQITDSVKLSRVYLVMVVLSAIVAAIGILNNNLAVVIGAMVIAPLLGPNVGLSLATTLGDADLARTSLKVNAVGLLTPLILSILFGLILTVNPNVPEIYSRTNTGLGDVALALASGCAGALAFTTGVPATLIGVMVAVALLPPVVTLGLLIGSGHVQLAFGALLLLLTNIICVNLAGVITFLVQGIRPITWWEVDIAKRVTRWAIITWALLLAALVMVIVLSQKL